MRPILNAYHWFLDALFPPLCLICRCEGAFLCDEHRQFHPAPANQAQFQHLDAIHAAVKYYDDTAETVVEHFKFHGFHQLADIMAAEIVSTIPPEVWRETTLVPIPLHWTRRWWRGYNQAEVLARAITRHTGSEVQLHLHRTRRTAQQARLGKTERAENLANAFVWTSNTIPQTVILIDDVVASGATLDNAAKALKQAGAQSVRAVVFARGGK